MTSTLLTGPRRTAGPLRALVLHEHGAGGTAPVAEAVAAGLSEAAAEVVLHRVEEVPTADVDDVDLLVVGAPTHAFARGSVLLGEVGTLRGWIAGLGHRLPGEGPVAASFDTRLDRAHRPWAASTRAACLLAHQGFHPVARPRTFLLDDPRGPASAGQLDRAQAWGRTLAGAAAPRLRLSA